ncbi:MAG: ATP-grasp domain-containing protein [Sedimentisphaerales bacterium]
MAKRKVLVTGVGGDIGQCMLKCLKDTGYEFSLLGCDIDPFAGGRPLVEKFYQAPRSSDSENYLRFITGLLESENVEYIFPTSEAEIEFFDINRELLKNNATIFINSHDIVKTFLDKYETALLLTRNGLPSPKTYLIERYEDELEYPYILKPRKGHGGKSLIQVNDAEEFRFFRDRLKDYVVQENVGSPDEEYTVTVFSTGKKSYSIAFKRSLGYGSLSKVAQLVQDARLERLAERIATVVSLEGSLNIQCRKIGSSYVPFEINPRFSSTVYARHYFGFQDVKWWIDLKEGRNIEYIPRFKSGTCVRTIGETFFDLQC